MITIIIIRNSSYCVATRPKLCYLPHNHNYEPYWSLRRNPL